MIRNRFSSFVAPLLVTWTGFVNRNPLKILLFSLLFSFATLWYTFGHMGVVTDTTEMMSKDLEYIKLHRAYQKEFSHQKGVILLVIDGDTPDLAIDAREFLYEYILDNIKEIKFIYAPGIDLFFKKNGLLYLDIDTLEETADNIAQAAPLLSSLASKPDLKTLFDLLNQSLEAGSYGVEIDFDPVFADFAKAVENANKGSFRPVSWIRLMGSKGPLTNEHRQLIILQPKLDYQTTLPAKEIISLLKKGIEELRIKYENGVIVRLTGDIPLEFEELRSVVKGAKTAGLLSFIMVAIVIYVGLGSGRLVAATLITLITGLIWTAWFASIAIGHLNMISVAFAVLFIGLGVDYAIHFCLRFRELLSRKIDKAQRASKENYKIYVAEAISETASDTGISLVICAVTTATGFFAFLPTSFTGVAELGLISGTGMFIGLFSTLTVLPALLTLMPCKAYDSSGFFINRCVFKISSFPLKHAQAVSLVTLLISTVSLGLIFNIRFDNNPLNLRDQSSESVTTFKELLKGRYSPWTLNIVAKNPSEASRLMKKLESLPSVRQVIRLEKFVPADQGKKLGIVDEIAFMTGGILWSEQNYLHKNSGKEVLVSIDNFQHSLAQYINKYRDKDEKKLSGAIELYNSLKFVSEKLNNHPYDKNLLDLLEKNLLISLPGRISSLKLSLEAEEFAKNDLPEHIKDMWISKNGGIRLEIIPAQDLNNEENLKTFLQEVHNITPDITGFPVKMTGGGQAVVSSFQEAFTLSFICIACFLLIMMPSFKEGVLALLPLIISALFTGAIISIIDLPLNFANIIGLPLILGIGVDNGIHIVHRFAIAQKEFSMPFSITTNRGVIFSGLTTVCSFGNLAVSPHSGMAGMGVLLTVGVGVTLIVTIMILPALLDLIFKKNMLKS